MKLLLVSDKESLPKRLDTYIEVIHFPVIKTVPLKFDNINTESFHVVIFTSSKGVKYFFKKENPEKYKEKIFITVGEKTKETLKKYGFSKIYTPEENTASGIAKFILENPSIFKDKKILFPRAKKGRKEILQILKNDFLVIPIDVYDTVINIPDNKDLVENFLKENQIKAVCFTSPSNFKNFLLIFSKNSKELLKNKVISAIGYTTKKEIEKAGFNVSLVPEKSSIEDLIKATYNYIASRTST